MHMRGYMWEQKMKMKVTFGNRNFKGEPKEKRATLSLNLFKSRIYTIHKHTHIHVYAEMNPPVVTGNK